MRRSYHLKLTVSSESDREQQQQHRPQVEEEVCGELEVDSVDEGKGEDGNVDVDDGGRSPRVPRNQLFGVVAAELEVVAVDLVRSKSVIRYELQSIGNCI